MAGQDSAAIFETLFTAALNGAPDDGGLMAVRPTDLGVVADIVRRLDERGGTLVVRSSATARRGALSVGE